ncbi:MAG: AbrB/MazE/SpoVT family DNA-binding domain-containing protein [Clostridiales Family XIII bacterium]|jgi:AbrB family looped-hinge helix DNA binding protein|nr:AbrB/MazE/SpoVT family DNA-binding domain-containing protein [Clostridiales Family XIII bacterium]
MIVDNAKVMSKGQITLPSDIRKMLRLVAGDRVTLVCEGNKVVLMNENAYASENPAIRAMREFQNVMQGEFERAGITSEEDILTLTKETRKQIYEESKRP